MIFCFKQKTAYEMRISDWSSDGALPICTITAGNAPGLNSGASAMLVASRAWAEANGVEPAARIVAHAVAAMEPGLFGLAPVPAVVKAVERAGWTLPDVERFEINEAFAAVPLAILQELGPIGRASCRDSVCQYV